MSEGFLADSPDNMLEVIAMLVRRLGGEITLDLEDLGTTQPCLLVTKYDGRLLELSIQSIKGTMN